MENTCIVCGAVIPEGRQICPNCMNKAELSDRKRKDESMEHPSTPSAEYVVNNIRECIEKKEQCDMHIVAWAEYWLRSYMEKNKAQN